MRFRQRHPQLEGPSGPTGATGPSGQSGPVGPVGPIGLGATGAVDTSFRIHDGDVLAIRLKEEGGESREFFATTHNDLFTGYLELTPCPSPYDGRRPGVTDPDDPPDETPFNSETINKGDKGDG